MKHNFLYGGQPAEAESAAGVKGVLISCSRRHDVSRLSRRRTFCRLSNTVRRPERHDRQRRLAAFYKACPRAGGDGEDHILDHSPEVLGLKRVEN